MRYGLRQLISYTFLFILGVTSTSTIGLYPAFAASEKIKFQSIRMEPSLDGDLVEIQSDKPFAFVTYTLKNPDRLVIDPVDVDLKVSDTVGALQGHVVEKMRLAYQADLVDYLEFFLREPADHRIESVDGKLLLRIRPKSMALLPPTGAEYTPEGQLPAVPDFSESEAVPKLTLKGPAEVWTLDQVLGYGLAHHRPVRIAQQEVELSQMKARETRRALYPAGTLKYSYTDGVASEVDFREYTAGLQIEQPLYYSGRLIEAYRQSLVNLQVSEKRKDKVKADYAQEVAQEYYQYIGAKKSASVQDGLIREAEDFLSKGRERFDKGLLTRLEVLNIESQLNQAKFQRATAENDLTLARIKFFQKLALDPNIGYLEVPAGFEPLSNQEVDLEEAIKLAARYRPDILVNSLLVKFQEYEERIAKEKGEWKIDLSGFFGTSAAAFTTEPLDAGDDYFVGFKATRNWGANSSTSSVTKTKTSPRLGQTTRTDSTVYSTEMGILDQLQSFSEVQQAKINLSKARKDLDEAKNSTFQEVQESYISYKKARLQLSYAQQKIAFREEQVKILKAQASVNETTPSQVLEAVMKLTEEKVGQAQATGNYYVALAKLNKAVGLVGHYR